MRPPVPSSVCPPQSRKSSFEQAVPPPWTDPRNAAPATFFLARNHHCDDDDLSSPDDSDVSHKNNNNNNKDSMYGVQSLDETLQQASLAGSLYDSDQDVFSLSADNRLSNSAVTNQLHHDFDDDDSTSRRPTLKLFDLLDSKRDASSSSLSSSSSSSMRRFSSGASLSRPLTPLNLSNPDEPSSLPSSPKSFTNQSLKPLDDISITDDLSSQAVASEEEDNECLDAPHSGPDSTAQLIMPSIKMPSRRPFTEQGKAMGWFKVLLAGAPGELRLLYPEVAS